MRVPLGPCAQQLRRGSRAPRGGQRRYNWEQFTTFDPYATITTQTSAAEVDALVQRLEARGSGATAQRMREDYFAQLPWRGVSSVLEVGCGTGVVTRAVAAREGIREVHGCDPCARFVAVAKARGGGPAQLSYTEASADRLPYRDAEFDMVLLHTTLTHVPGWLRGDAARECKRVLRTGGVLSIFDSDIPSWNFAGSVFDPLRCAVDCYSHDWSGAPSLVELLPAMLRVIGIPPRRVHVFPHLETEDGCGLEVVDRACDFLRDKGIVGDALAAALKAEARERVAQGRFAVQMQFVHCYGVKPGGS